MTAIVLSPSLTAHTGDVAIQLSENALNKFLAAHYVKHPEFYDHSRTTAPNSPLYSVDVDDHGTNAPFAFGQRSKSLPVQMRSH